mmetsp:Transcript_21623/g.63478  ORF Transcript_21623/g.63478 Transcript_21623/m.63478 type:complete len:200 (-) Transcript_21623:299-898(-)
MFAIFRERSLEAVEDARHQPPTSLVLDACHELSQVEGVPPIPRMVSGRGADCGGIGLFKPVQGRAETAKIHTSFCEALNGEGRDGRHGPTFHPGQEAYNERTGRVGGRDDREGVDRDGQYIIILLVFGSRRIGVAVVLHGDWSGGRHPALRVGEVRKDGILKVDHAGGIRHTRPGVVVVAAAAIALVFSPLRVSLHVIL